MTVTLALLGYAVVIAVLAPRLLDGRWLRRSPRLAVTLWHTTGVSVLLAVVLAGIFCVATPGLVQMCLAALTGRTGAAGAAAAGAGLVAPALVLGRLARVMTRLVRTQRIERLRHRELLALCGRHDPRLGATVLPSAAAAVYCVPGTDRIVLTRGAIGRLDGAELRAVLAHERAHLEGRHHLLLVWAAVLERAFPAVPLFLRGRQQTAELVELLADDRARRHVSGESLALAIAALAPGAAQAPGLAASGGSVFARVQRLIDPPVPLPVATRLGGAGAAACLLVAPVLVAVVPAVFAAGLAMCPVMFG